MDDSGPIFHSHVIREHYRRIAVKQRMSSHHSFHRGPFHPADDLRVESRMLPVAVVYIAVKGTIANRGPLDRSILLNRWIKRAEHSPKKRLRDEIERGID